MEGAVYQLALPANSIFGKGDNGKKLPIQAYAAMLGSNGVPIGAVVTEMRFDTSVEHPKLTFKPVRPLTEEEYKLGKTQGECADALSAITMTVTARDTKVREEGPTEQKPAEKPKGKVTATAEPEPEPEAAPRKTAKKAEAPAGKKDLAAAMAAWGSDDDD